MVVIEPTELEQLKVRHTAHTVLKELLSNEMNHYLLFLKEKYQVTFDKFEINEQGEFVQLQ